MIDQGMPSFSSANNTLENQIEVRSLWKMHRLDWTWNSSQPGGTLGSLGWAIISCPKQQLPLSSSKFSIKILFPTASEEIFFFFFFWPYSAACRILVPWPGIEPVPPAMEAQSLKPLDHQGSPASEEILAPLPPPQSQAQSHWQVKCISVGILRFQQS